MKGQFNSDKEHQKVLMNTFFIDCVYLNAEGLDQLYQIAKDIDVLDGDRFKAYLNDVRTGCRIVTAGDKISFSVDSEAELLLRLKYDENMHLLS